jgi:plastocyanin
MSDRSFRSLRRAATLLSLTTLGLAACGVAGSHPSAASSTTMTMPMTMPMTASPAAAKTPPVATDAVTIENFAFGPAAVTVKVGTTVTWTNKDDEAHTVFFAFDGSRSPILVNNANIYHKTFTTPGTYTYHCTIHPFMTGVVVVTA